jgi:hypothetical protein
MGLSRHWLSAVTLSAWLMHAVLWTPCEAGRIFDEHRLSGQDKSGGQARTIPRHLQRKGEAYVQKVIAQAKARTLHQQHDNHGHENQVLPSITRHRGARGGNQRRLQDIESGTFYIEPVYSKSSKGMMGKGKGSVPALIPIDVTECQTASYKFFYDEVNAGRSQSAIGDTLEYPLYDVDTEEYAGYYQDASIFAPKDFSNCVFYAVYNFDMDDKLFYKSQVVTMGSCSGSNNSIVGGTGRYGCATGYDSFRETDSDKFGIVDLKLCTTACPPEETAS